jgi:NDP-sugar pyrophosphorylase family protein
VDALLFAAGLGTRLRPLTENMPKALVEVNGVPMIERVARRVIAAGARRLVINVHHFPEQIEKYVKGRKNFGVEVVFSREPHGPLDTGGGLLHAAPYLRGDAPWLLHNTDVLSTIDLAGMIAAHSETKPVATLAVNQRDSSRYLLFDDDGLYGHGNRSTGKEQKVRLPRGTSREFSFCGIHVVSPTLRSRITERGIFGIFEPYLRLASEGHRIDAHDVGDTFWMDIGSHDALREADDVMVEKDAEALAAAEAAKAAAAIAAAEEAAAAAAAAELALMEDEESPI